ncbi:MAG: radical SAM protein [Acidobacteriota bacterium]|nr:radical SAM protein [Acidobacteriota bacterium]MDQ5870807.1 radical SAM protein [Acidobacteriota bacterium]
MPSVSLDTLWFQVAGTICNLACTHCFISCSPTNHSHEMLTLAQVQARLAEAVPLGVREYYFTGGEPFLNPEIFPILEETLRQGPASVLTNGLFLTPDRCHRLRELFDASDYSLDVRVSIDGYTPAVNDPIRGAGTFEKILRGIANLADAGINPVVTVTEACDEAGTAEGRRHFLDWMRSIGISRPRLKVLSLFRIGEEEHRLRAYESWESLRGRHLAVEEAERLQCSSCRMVTSRGVYVCPILIDEPRAMMGETLGETLRPFELRYAACFTCHEYGVTCRT